MCAESRRFYNQCYGRSFIFNYATGRVKLLPANNRRVALEVRIPSFGVTPSLTIGSVEWEGTDTESPGPSETEGDVDPVTGEVDTITSYSPGTSTYSGHLTAAATTLTLTQIGGLCLFLGSEPLSQVVSMVSPDGGHLRFYLERHGGSIFQEVWLDSINPVASCLEVHETISSGPIGDNY